MPYIDLINSLNARDLLHGVKSRVRVAPWQSWTGGVPPGVGLANYPGATGTYSAMAAPVELGLTRGTSYYFDQTVKEIMADNAVWALGSALQECKAGIKGTIMQASLRLLAQTLNQNPVATTGDVVVSSTAHTAGFAIDEPTGSESYWWVLLEAWGVMKPGFSEDATAQYIKRSIFLWKCFFIPKSEQAYTREGEVLTQFDCRACMDTSVTFNLGVAGRVGVMYDSVAG